MMSKCAWCSHSMPTPEGGWKCRYVFCYFTERDLDKLIEKIFQKN